MAINLAFNSLECAAAAPRTCGRYFDISIFITPSSPYVCFQPLNKESHHYVEVFSKSVDLSYLGAKSAGKKNTFTRSSYFFKKLLFKRARAVVIIIT